MSLLTDPITGQPLSPKDLAMLKQALDLFKKEGPKRYAAKGYPQDLVDVLNEIVGVAFSGGFIMGCSWKDNPAVWEQEANERSRTDKPN